MAKKNKKRQTKSSQTNQRSQTEKPTAKQEAQTPEKSVSSSSSTTTFPMKKILVAAGTLVLIGAVVYSITSSHSKTSVPLTSGPEKQVIVSESGYKIVAQPSKKSYAASDNISFEVQNASGLNEKATVQWENYNGPKKVNVQGSFTSFERGEHEIKATICAEGSKECKEETININIKNSPPTKPNIQMSPGKDITSDTNVLFSHTFVSDPDGDEVMVEWKVDDRKWMASPPNGYFSKGKHTIRIRAVDSKGTSSKVSKKVIHVSMGEKNTYAKVADEQEKRQNQEGKITGSFKEGKTKNTEKKSVKKKDKAAYQCISTNTKTLTHPVSVSGVEYTECSTHGISVGEVLGSLSQKKLQFQGADFYDEFKLDIKNQHAFKTNNLQDRLYVYTLKNEKEVDQALKNVKKQTKDFDRYTVFPYKVQNSLILYLQNDKEKSIKDTIEDTLDMLRQKPKQK